MRALIAALLVTLAGAPSAYATYPGHNGRIAVGVGVMCNPTTQCGNAIWTLQPNGRSFSLLTRSTAGDNLLWSADGRFLIAGNRLVSADGKRTKALPGGQDPTVSPDGRWVAVVRPPCSHGPCLDQDWIYVMRLDGSGKRKLVQGNWPRWSPDGKKLAYHVTETTGRTTPVAVVSVASGRRLVTIARAQYPEWSPSGATLLVTRMYGYSHRTYVVRARDGHAVRELSWARKTGHVIWSPDGRRYAYTTNEKVWTRSAATGVATAVVVNNPRTSGVSISGPVAWQPQR